MHIHMACTHTHSHTHTFTHARTCTHTQYMFDCSKVSSLPNVGFTINGQTMELTGNEYVLKVGKILHKIPFN